MPYMHDLRETRYFHTAIAAKQTDVCVMCNIFINQEVFFLSKNLMLIHGIVLEVMGVLGLSH